MLLSVCCFESVCVNDVSSNLFGESGRCVRVCVCVYS